MMPRSGHGIPRCSGAAGPGHEEEAVTEDRPAPSARALSGRTAWARSLQTPLRVFLGTEMGSAAALVAALVWINISASSYEAVWGARLSVQLAGAGVSLDLREWVSSGLMTFFSSCSGWRLVGAMFVTAEIVHQEPAMTITPNAPTDSATAVTTQVKPPAVPAGS
jgi:hypothetical protein